MTQVKRNLKKAGTSRKYFEKCNYLYVEKKRINFMQKMYRCTNFGLYLINISN